MIRLSLLLLFGSATLVRATPGAEAGIKFYREKNYAEAEAALRKVVGADPSNAAANYYLGLTLTKSNDPDALEKAVPYLQKASELAPGNSDYIDDYGVSCLRAAGIGKAVHRSR